MVNIMIEMQNYHIMTMNSFPN